jgi:beta-fructofuranosidase
MTGLPLAAVAFLLCLLASSSPATASAAGRDGRTAYHFQPAENWQNGEHAGFSIRAVIA